MSWRNGDGGNGREQAVVVHEQHYVARSVSYLLYVRIIVLMTKSFDITSLGSSGDLGPMMVPLFNPFATLTYVLIVTYNYTLSLGRIDVYGTVKATSRSSTTLPYRFGDGLPTLVGGRDDYVYNT